MGKTRENIEAVGGISSHICNILQNGGAGGATFQCLDLGSINGHVEAIGGVTYRFLTTGNG